MSLPFLALREKLLNGELFGWADGYRELRTELQRGDRGRVWPWRQGSWAGACSIIPASVGYLLVRPELRNGPNMNRRNISRWRTATKTQFNFNTMTFMLNFGRYVLVSKSSICSAIVHRESSWWRIFHFHSENFT